MSFTIKLVRTNEQKRRYAGCLKNRQVKQDQQTWRHEDTNSSPSRRAVCCQASSDQPMREEESIQWQTSGRGGCRRVSSESNQEWTLGSDWKINRLTLPNSRGCRLAEIDAYTGAVPGKPCPELMYLIRTPFTPAKHSCWTRPTHNRVAEPEMTGTQHPAAPRPTFHFGKICDYIYIFTWHKCVYNYKLKYK